MKRRSFLAASCGFAQTNDPGTWSDATQEEFLHKAKVLSAKEIGHGVTKPIRVEMSWGEKRHAAKVQRVDKELPPFIPDSGAPVPMRDSWRYNIAAYRVDRLLDLRMVVVAVERWYEKKPAAFSWWADNVKGEEIDRVKQGWVAPDELAFARQMAVAKVFDELIFNIDRNLSNFLITQQWQLVLIDHSRCFTAFDGIRNRANLTGCSRALLAGLERLNASGLRAATTKLLTPVEADAVLRRRDRILQHFREAIQKQGEEKVLFG